MITKKHWTKEEVMMLREMYQTYRTNEVAKSLGRSYASVYEKAYRLNISKRAVKPIAVSEPNRTNLVRRESYVAPKWAIFREGADNHLKHKSRGF